LVSVWLIGAIFGHIPLLTFACLLLAWLIYAGATASLGLWYSLISKSNMRALIFTTGTLALLSVGLIVLPMQGRARSISPGRTNGLREWVFRFEASMAPPFVFDRLIPAIAAPQRIGARRPASWQWQMLVLCSACWLAIGAWSWNRANSLLNRRMFPKRGKPTAVG
jgi:hypothetical protein